ncbi:hypothetical protein ABK040_012204 [Willaertia magna]
MSSTLENYKNQILTTFTVDENVKIPTVPLGDYNKCFYNNDKSNLELFNQQYNLEACDPVIKQNITYRTPDHVWLAIAQGFAKHIDNNAEELRNKFVDHEGKKTIVIDGDKYGIKTGNPYNDWPSVINEFSDEIDKRIKTNARDLIECNFSTTDKSASIASKVCLMDAMKNYFEYRVSLCCGLPQVTLLGTIQDWENIRQRTQTIGEEYSLQWWTDRLLFILDKFIDSAKGKVDKPFWNRICHRTVDTNDIPKGLSIAPFVLDDNGNEMKYEFVGGFLGIAQMPETLALMPVVGWGVRPEMKEQ